MADKYIPNFILMGENGGLRNPLAKIGQPVNFIFGEGGPTVFKGTAKQVASKLPAVIPQAVSGAGKQMVGKFMGMPAFMTEAGLQIGNYLYNTLPINKSGDQMLQGIDFSPNTTSAMNLGNIGALRQAQYDMEKSINPFVRNTMSVDTLNRDSRAKYLDANQERLAKQMSNQKINKPQATSNKVQNKQLPELPVLPQEAIGGQVLNSGALPTQNTNESQVVQVSSSVAPSEKLADSIGIKYEEPLPDGDKMFADPRKIQYIMEQYGMTPDEYKNAMQRDMSRQYAQQVANRLTGTNVTPYSELQAQKDIVKYLSEGYNTEQSLINARRQVAEAYAMSKATGLPASYFMNVKDALQYIINPAIKGREDRLGYRTLLGNEVKVQQLRNQIEKYKADMGYTTDVMKMSNDLKIAQMNGDIKTISSLLSSAVFDPNFSSTDFVKIASTVMTPEKAKELLSLKQYINMVGNDGQGRVNNLNRENLQAMLFTGIMGK